MQYLLQPQAKKELLSAILNFKSLKIEHYFFSALVAKKKTKKQKRLDRLLTKPKLFKKKKINQQCTTLAVIKGELT